MKPARATLHLARESDAPLPVLQLEHESDEHYAKRCGAIRALGVRWVRHPAYVFTSLHSTNPDLWQPAHRAMWQVVHERAAADRARNPAAQRTQAIRQLIGGTS